MFLLVGGIKWINVKVVRSSEEDSNKRVLFLIFIFFFLLFLKFVIGKRNLKE